MSKAKRHGTQQFFWFMDLQLQVNNGNVLSLFRSTFTSKLQVKDEFLHIVRILVGLLPYIRRRVGEKFEGVGTNFGGVGEKFGGVRTNFAPENAK